MVCRNSAMCGRLQVLLRQPEQHGVDPLAVSPVRAPLHALADVAAALRVRDRALVEAVDLQLDAVEAELAEEQPLEHPRRIVADLAPPEPRIDREAAGLRDSMLLADAVERDTAGALAVDLDDVPAVCVGRP